MSTSDFLEEVRGVNFAPEHEPFLSQNSLVEFKGKSVPRVAQNKAFSATSSERLFWGVLLLAD